MKEVQLTKAVKSKIICIVGPTGTGKSDLAIYLANKLNGEIINADATQFYRQMDIGTNKVTPREQKLAIHHLLDVATPDQNYTVSQYQTDGRKIIAQIQAKEKQVIIVGGSGLYINALLQNYSFLKEDQNKLSIAQKTMLEQLNNQDLWNLLVKIDPDYSKIVHLNNRQRVMRAIVFYYLHHKTKSQHIKEIDNNDLYDVVYLGLTYQDKIQYGDKLRKRINDHAQSGLITEVKELYQKYGNNKNLKAISYKEIIEYLNHQITLEQALTKILENNLKLAKKQLTWFRHQIKKIKWFEINYQESFQKTIIAVEKFLKEQNH